MLLDIVSGELDVEIAGVRLHDFVEAEVERFQRGKIRGRLDLSIEFKKFLVRIEVFHAHAAYRTPFGIEGRPGRTVIGGLERVTRGQ